MIVTPLHPHAATRRCPTRAPQPPGGRGSRMQPPHLLRARVAGTAPRRCCCCHHHDHHPPQPPPLLHPAPLPPLPPPPHPPPAPPPTALPTSARTACRRAPRWRCSPTPGCRRRPRCGATRPHSWRGARGAPAMRQWRHRLTPRTARHQPSARGVPRRPATSPQTVPRLRGLCSPLCPRRQPWCVRRVVCGVWCARVCGV